MREAIRRLGSSRAARATGWTFAGQLGSYGIRLISTIVLTRLLSPADYGAIAVIMVVSTILTLISDFGIRSSIINSSRCNDPEYQDTAWTIQMIRGGALAALTVLLGLGLAGVQSTHWLPPDAALARPDLPMLIAASALSPLVLGAMPIRVHLASRHLQMRQLTIVDLSAQAVTSVMTLGLAALTRSVWSVVVAMTIGYLWQVWYSFRTLSGQPHRWRIEPGARAELVRFGRWILLSSFITAFTLNADRMFLGVWSDAATLGHYAIASTFPSIVGVLAARSIGAVAAPRIAEAYRESASAFKRSFRRFLLVSDAFTATASGFLIGSAHLITRVLYDDRYQASAEMLSIVAWSTFLARTEVYNAAHHCQRELKRLPLLSTVALVYLLTVVPLCFEYGGVTLALWALALRHLVTVPLQTIYMWQDKLLDWRAEMAAPLFLLLGWLAGSAVQWLFL